MAEHWVRIEREYNPQYPNPIQVSAGDSVTVGLEDGEYPGWKWCQAADGRQGWVPVELLSSNAILLEDYSAQELAVQPGEEVVAESVRHDWLLVRNACGERGWIPASCV